MEHSFNTGLAKIVGVEGAVILKHLFYWVQKNYGNNKHFYDGSYWTYNSVRGFSIIFDYLSTKQINRILNNLIKDGYVKTGNYNSNKMDRTMWYAFTEKGIELMKKNGFVLTVYTENADIRHKSYSYIEDDGLKVATIVFSDEQIDLFATTPEKTLCIDVLRDMQDLQHTLKLCGIKKEIEL